jgi:hypothetical protein
MVPTHPLAPAVEVDAFTGLMSGKVGRSDEPEVGVEFQLRQGIGEADHA